MRTSTLLLLLLVACPEPKGFVPDPLFQERVAPASPNPPADSGTSAPVGLRVSGLELDSGFGAALLVQEDRIWVGAPHGVQGTVYRVNKAKLTQVVTGQGRLGSSLAMGGSGLRVGAPVRGEGLGAVVDSSGAVVVEGIGSTGLAMASGDTALIAHGGGYSAGEGTLIPTPSRPTSIAQLGEQVGIGMALGPLALSVGDHSLDRPAALDEAGFSLAVGDLDGDGAQEWILGAPGAGVVHIVDPDTLEIRTTVASDHAGFGFALAVCDLSGDGRDDLLVGAPGAELHTGAALLYTDLLGNDSPDQLWVGTNMGDRLGTAVGCSTGLVVLGAPGMATDTGHIRVIRP